MAVTTILAAALRGSVTAPSFTIPTSAPAHVRLRLVSPTYGSDPTLTFDVRADQSPDGVLPFTPWIHSGSVGGGAGQPTGKFGALSDGLWAETVSLDGTAVVIKAIITVAPPFVWGLTAEIL